MLRLNGGPVIYMAESRKSHKKAMENRKSQKKPTESRKKYLAVNQKMTFLGGGKLQLHLLTTWVKNQFCM